MKLYLAWGIALFSTLASLFFSEILKFPPCSLCWYQRIFMYPLVIVLPIGILAQDKNVSKYLVSLSLVGTVIAGYHTLIYHNIVTEAFTLCTAELSCKTKQFELFNLISIPVMSLASFAALFGLGFKELRNEKRA